MSIITVTNSQDSGPGSLRDALANAQAGDTIEFASSLANETITLTSGQLSITESITIDGSGAANLTISGNNASRVFFIAQSEDATIKDLIITNGKTTGKGGGIQVSSYSSLTLINSQVNNNTADQGGGVQVGYTSHATIINSSFDNNDGTATGSGFSAGAIATENDGSLSIKDSEFTNNRGVSGGAVYNLLGSLTVENSVFVNNTATLEGGAIFTDGANPSGPNPTSSTVGGTIRISDSWFEGNESVGGGGALYLYIYNPDQVIVENSTIINNTTTTNSKGNAQGGGIRANGNVTIRNVTLANNTTEKQGGALWLDGDSTSANAVINIENSTFSGNTATDTDGGFGGAIAINPSATATLNVTNSTIVDNYAGENGGAFWVVEPSQQTTLTNSIVANNTANDGQGTGQQVAYQLLDGGGNIEYPEPQPKNSKVTANAQVIDPQLGELQEIDGVLVRPLLKGSPAIDAGVEGGSTTDARGLTRDSQPDIGAFEYSATDTGIIISQTDGSTNVTEGGATDSYSLVLNSQPTANVTISINSGNQLTSNTNTLTFTANNWNVAQNVTVTAVNDAVAQGDRVATIQYTATSSDTDYDGITINPVSVNISDNDTPGIIISQTGGSTNVTEGGATDSYSLVLNSQPTANVTISINSGNQLTSDTNNLTFTANNWNVAQTVTVTAVNDAVAQGDRVATIQYTATSSDTDYDGITINPVSANISDNDTPNLIINETGGSTNVTEGGATDSYSLVLNSQPTADVTISINSSNQLTSDTNTLTFTAQNWNVARNVTVTAVDDAVVEGSHSGTIVITAASVDANYNQLVFPTINVGITDNDTVINGTAGRDTLTGSSSSDYITGFQGGDMLTGGAGSDQFIYTSIRDAGDTITDFQAGIDKIVLTQLFQSYSLGSLDYATATVQGYLNFRTTGSDTNVLIDPDGLLGSARSTSLITVQGVDQGTLASANNFLF
ncbi:beta strand repeat-containing protein [Cylindrospermum sp. FACHB-282]|uniref:beta strand repeat-containing protein n=1 Tax=Cylindrospermum sp. FACHB-282 TaxID=2692794 RepID=UPI001682686E|nr:choice-of-anchor Q domain-containing protein [Cylindrospermum sp. FACHB-282]MBD2383863.1 right-handed parallel beta-helix repeat-containing protein [Cylindrospermum sp. FACHB-282]